jgi:hypothetical protein
MKSTFSKFLFLFLLFLIACQPKEHFAILKKGNGETLSVKVELADTEEKREHGLMFRKNLPEGEGMLFVFSEETDSEFWMKDTPIFLDMIFFKNHQIVGTVENAVPYSTRPLSPGVPYDRTLEVPGGYVSEHALKKGDIMELR